MELTDLIIPISEMVGLEQQGFCNMVYNSVLDVCATTFTSTVAATIIVYKITKYFLKDKPLLS